MRIVKFQCAVRVKFMTARAKDLMIRPARARRWV